MKEKNKQHWWNNTHQIKLTLQVICSVLVIIASNFYLQLSQNQWSWSLAFKFAFSWHTEKFFLGCLVLLVFWLFWLGVSGSWKFSLSFYTIFIGILGFANSQKMMYRQEPIYPDDLGMVTELSLMKEMIGLGPFICCILLILLALSILGYGIYRSFRLPKKQQIGRIICLVTAFLGLIYVNNFNRPGNLLRSAYNRSALWISYSQQMNYYNTGFMGGFLYNLKIDAMEKPNDYSQKTIESIVANYQAADKVVSEEEQPNIVYIMSESFSNPLRLTGINAVENPLTAYQEVAGKTFSGQMLSQNYGGGTANIEFEALTGLSMEPFNTQMTTPYTMLMPKLDQLPSLVSLLKGRGYEATAIHPYNTSMYKRKDVYQTLGFDTFISEDTMSHTDKIENNPYISDQAAFSEVSDLLKNDQAQFIHLVTMQGHTPYADKYPDADFGLTGMGSGPGLENYMQDLSYSSEALADFLTSLAKLPRRTLVVFWGDHLPGFYSEQIKAANTEVDLHLTEFLMYDSAAPLALASSQENIISPVYFGADLFERSQVPMTSFYRLLADLRQELPAFEKGFYLSPSGDWTQEMALSAKGTQVYHDYQLIQYDLVSGEQYSLATDFFEK